MKKLCAFLFTITLFTFSCRTKTNLPDVTKFIKVEVKKKTSMPPEIVFFSTAGGNAVILCNDIAATVLDSMLWKKYNSGFREMGVGNGFYVSEQGRVALFTANHCAIGLQNIAVKATGDMAVIPVEFLKSMQGNITVGDPYKLAEEDFVNNDSAYVRGYLFGKDRQVYEVVLSGRGTVIDAEEISKNKEFQIKSSEPFEGKSLWFALEKNIDLSGLSGAPAFNEQGQVIGVYAGRCFTEVNTDTVWYARVSLIQ